MSQRFTTAQQAVRVLTERVPLGPRLLFYPRPDRRGAGDAYYVVTRLRWDHPSAERGRKGRCWPEMMRVTCDRRATDAIDAHDRYYEYPIQAWHRPWPGRIWRFLTGRC